MKVGDAAISTGVLVVTGFFAVVAPAAYADTRRVVLVNAAVDQAAGAEQSARLRRALTDQADLDPIPAGLLARALEEVVLPDTSEAARLAEVDQILERAREALAQFSYDTALAEVERAEARLLETPPTAAVWSRLAEGNFIAGRAYLDRGDKQRAISSFRAVRNLDPDRPELDPARFLAELVAAFTAAGKPLAATARVKCSTPYDNAIIFVDGRQLAPEVSTAQLAPGIHYFVATFPNHRSIGQRMVLVDGQERMIKLRVILEDVDQRALSLRRRLAVEPELGYDELARAAVTLAGVDAAIVVRGERGALFAMVYDARSNRSSEWKPLSITADRELFQFILPRPRLVIPPSIEVPEPPARPVPWYQKNWGRGFIAGGGGIALTVAGLIVRSLSNSDNQEWTYVECLGFSCP